MRATIIYGVDPGVTGAYARVPARGGAAVHDLPTRPRGGFVRRELDAIALAKSWAPDAGRSVVLVVEHVAARPGQGVASMFSFGVSRGVILGVAAGLGFTVVEVRPQTWRAAVGLGGSDKRASLERARVLFPSLRAALARAADHNRADALLLAVYGARTLLEEPA